MHWQTRQIVQYTLDVEGAFNTAQERHVELTRDITQSGWSSALAVW